jgi:hypothetical protein
MIKARRDHPRRHLAKITGNHLSLLAKPIHFDIFGRDPKEIPLQLDADQAAFRYPCRQAKKCCACPSADVKNALAGIGWHGGREKNRINRDPIPFLRLIETKSTAEQRIFAQI